MKITEITTRRVRISSEPWFGGGSVPSGFPPYWEYPLTTVSTDEGIDGYTMGHGPLGSGRANAYQIHDVYYYDLVGRNPLHTEGIWQDLRRKNRHLYSMTDTVLGEIDVALWDIKGKAAGMPVTDLIGRARNEVPCYASAPPQSIGSVMEVEIAVRRAVDQHYAGLKLQMLGHPNDIKPRLVAARATAPNHFPLMLDTSGELTYVEALEIGRVLDGLNFAWFEEPIPDRNIEQLRRLAHQIFTPVLAAETVRLHELPEYLTTGATDIGRGDVHLKAGITGLMKAIGMCDLLGMGMEIHTAASPILDIANLHVACATEISQFVETHHPMFRFGLKGDPLRINERGCQVLPDGPGLGIEIDWDWMEDHTVEVLKGSTL